MFANALRISFRHALRSTKPRAIASSRIIRPSIAAALSSRTVYTANNSLSGGSRGEEKKVLYLSNLPWSVEMDDLKEFAERFGPIERITMPDDHTGRFAGFANVVFSNAEDALACLEHGKQNPVSFAGRRSMLHLIYEARETALPRHDVLKQFGKNEFRSEKLDTDTMFIGNLPWDATAKEIKDVFESFGQLVRVHISTSPSGRPRGFAHVQFNDQGSVRTACERHAEEPFTLHGRVLALDPANNKNFGPREATLQNRGPTEPFHELYFTRFKTGTEDEIRQMLPENKPKFIKFFTDRETGEPTGSGFIIFNTVEQATQALNDIKNMFSDDIHVEYARNRPLDNRRRKAPAKASYGGDWEGGRRTSDY